MRPIWIIVIFCVTSVPLLATELWQETIPGGFSASINLSSQSLSIPQQLQVIMELTFPENYNADVDTIRSNLLRNDTPNESPFNLVSEEISKPKLLPNRSLSQKLVFVLQPQIPGNFNLTFLDIPFLTGEGSSETKKEIISGIFPITVTLPTFNPEIGFPSEGLLNLSPALPIEPEPKLLALLIDNKEIIAAEAHKNVEIFKAKSLPWTALGALIVVLLGYLAFKHAPRKPKERFLTPKSIENYTLALKNLELLKVQPSPDPGMIDAFYVHLSQSVRFYIEEKYHLNAPTKTTQEFFQEIQAHPMFPPATISLLHDFLDTTDRIKFAKQRASLRDCLSAAQTASLLLGQKKI